MPRLPDAPGAPWFTCLVVIGALGAVAAVPAGRAAWMCRRELAAARGLAPTGDWTSAHVVARHAAEARLWGDPCAGEAVAQLITWGDEASQRGERERALDAWVQARHAVGVTHRAAGSDVHGPLDRRIAGLLGSPAVVPAPQPRGATGWLTALGMALAVAGVSAAAWRGLTPEGRVVARPMWGWAATALVGTLVWIAAVSHA